MYGESRGKPTLFNQQGRPILKAEAYFLFQSVSGGTNWARDVELLFNLEPLGPRHELRRAPVGVYSDRTDSF